MNTLFDGPEIDLPDMLEAREARVARRVAALSEHGRPCLTLSIVTPGPVKDSPLSRLLAQAAREEVEARFAELRWRFDRLYTAQSATGPEALYSVACDPFRLKTEMVTLEESHPLGRLWDLDVHDTDGNGLSRHSVGLAPRRCLVCGEPAHGCTRSAAHPLDTLRATMVATLRTWQKATRVAPAEKAGKP